MAHQQAGAQQHEQRGLPLFHLAVGVDQLEGAVLTNPIAHQIGIQNPESRAQIGGFAAQPEDI